MIKKLRKIFHKPRNASFNMACDEFLLNLLVEKKIDGFIRFYSWNPPTFSFGRFQVIEKFIDLKKIKASGFGAVRRMTGGKMVFHANEITFSLGAPIVLINSILPETNSFIALFKKLLSPIVQTFKNFNILLDFPQQSQVNTKGEKFSCYSQTVGHSIMLNNKKFIGAAGIIKEGCLMIHGSIPTSPSEIPVACFIKPIPATEFPTVFLQDYLSHEQISLIPQYTANVFDKFFGFTEVTEGLSQAEEAIITALGEEKYNLFFCAT